MTLPTESRAVVIGGGVAGCSVAYHLAERGWDVVLLERKQLTCGTTWHAAGLIGQLRPNANMTRLARYSAELYRGLSDETGIGTGMKTTGSLTVALTADRLTEIRRQASLARAFGVAAQEVTAEDVRRLYPHIETADVHGAVHLPDDGQCDPAGVAMALAKGARARGAQIVEGVTVTDVTTEAGRVTGVAWARGEETGTIATRHVVNCGGMWGRALAARSGVTLPLHACEHFYLVTEPIPGFVPEGQRTLPVLRIPDEYAYYKEDAGKLLLGAFEPVAKPWATEHPGGIPPEFCFDELPYDFDHFEPILELAAARMPLLAEAGIHTFFNGPESFTPDDRYYLGAAPELEGYWVAAGFNSIGIVSSGGAGMALARWMDEGQPPFDLWDVDIRRAQPFQRSTRFLKARVTETLGLLYADHWPFRQPETARGVRRTALHAHLEKRGAVFGETAGWERANWFARDGQARAYDYDWTRQNWFENRAAEHRAVREDAGLFDLSTFGKIRIEGRDACRFLNRVCAGQMDVAPGRIVYTQMLNERGGIECDLTVTRLSKTAYLAVVPAFTVRRDMAWLRRHIGDDFVVVTDVTSGEAVIAVMGPRSREVLRAAGAADLSNETHPFGTAREIEIGLTLARAHRVSYVGELGWELYVPTDHAAHVLEAIMAIDASPALVGLHALDSLRLEKGFRHFGHDITDEDHVLEAGLGFAVKTDKGDFIGRDAVLRRKEEGLGRRLVQFLLSDAAPVLHHDETILCNGAPVSILTSGSYGHTLGAAVGLGYVPEDGDVLANCYEIEIAGERVPATASLKPLYDPTGARMRA
ncbi:GcvT family protein [Jannaschia seohaensis]|uniref:4-methylaminobutanoate oxidase (Formaldehyde-forming) n=1 Tax=Jannaschia seohaensis TaxID=475081 RepID=A0A2Y9B7I4_9RHOB|nr:FAD-dependent oxidoreductase [Jannaschia seohaensis]PWJ14429.1 4-methylaminobutanoate oxidase (formaldehyde-forming) [Jannaschia seohaensis]SSA50159.1 4-methylaminobutanoate oxidase (formaldehyde-forming) [Jannaschia seohaensis]